MCIRDRGQAHALWLCGDLLDGDLLVLLGDIIIDADFAHIAHPTTDAVFQTMEIDDPRHFGCLTVGPDGFIDHLVEKPQSGDYRLAAAGSYWFRDGRRLWQTLDQTLKSGRQTNGEYFLADAFQIMLARGDRIGVQPINWIVDVGSPGNRLAANRRLLECAAGQGAPSAARPGIAIIPPVYIHPSAIIEASVIGPHATIGRDARVSGAVIAASIIEAGATVVDCVLRDSVIGENATVIGAAQALILGDDSKMKSAAG